MFVDCQVRTDHPTWPGRYLSNNHLPIVPSGAWGREPFCHLSRSMTFFPLLFKGEVVPAPLLVPGTGGLLDHIKQDTEPGVIATPKEFFFVSSGVGIATMSFRQQINEKLCPLTNGGMNKCREWTSDAIKEMAMVIQTFRNRSKW